MLRPFFYFLVLSLGVLLAAGASAQPVAGTRLLTAWLESQREAREAAGVIRYVERTEREVDGPATARNVRTEANVELGADGLRRRVTRAEVDGRTVPPQRFAAVERRLAEALGPGAEWTQEAPLDRMLLDLRAEGEARQDVLGGRPVWVVPARSGRSRGDGPSRGGGEATLWFSRGTGPVRLVQARFDRTLRGGGTSTLIATFAPVGALDLPTMHRVEAVVRQRRRLRLFTVLVHAEVTYSDYRVGGR